MARDLDILMLENEELVPSRCINYPLKARSHLLIFQMITVAFEQARRVVNLGSGLYGNFGGYAEKGIVVAVDLPTQVHWVSRKIAISHLIVVQKSFELENDHAVDLLLFRHDKKMAIRAGNALQVEFDIANVDKSRVEFDLNRRIKQRCEASPFYESLRVRPVRHVFSKEVSRLTFVYTAFITDHGRSA
jgi:hypothetical protein